VDVVRGVAGEDLDIGFGGVVMVGEEASDGAWGTGDAGKEAKRDVRDACCLGKVDFGGELLRGVLAGGSEGEVCYVVG
jgi:hypothetical protein